MTAPRPDPWTAFRDALPPSLRHTLNDTQRAVSLVGVAVREQGWTPKQLAAECSRDLEGVYKPGGVITTRLTKASEHPPVGRAAKVPGALLPWCTDDCKTRAGWIEDQNGQPIARCPCRTPQKATA